MNNQLWGGRFSKKPSEIMKRFNASINYDKRLAYEDITQSIAHVNMLAKCKIISKFEKDEIVDGLKQIEKEISSGRFSFSIEDEDIHMNIERRLIELKGETAKKIHTARSRNDQVATDFRLFAKKASSAIIKTIIRLQQTIISLAKENTGLIMPGFTHLQHAQPLLVSHWFMAYFEMLSRDIELFFISLKASDSLPLGACALAGTSFPIDRSYTQKALRFSRLSNNSIDAVSDRDFAIDFLYAAAICGMHLSRLSEELILFSTSEFGFVRLSEEYSTGSSIMPQKRNPDSLELIRGKTGRLYGNLVSLLTVMKSLPLAYDKDMQEDKEPLFDSFDTISGMLEIMSGVLSSLVFDKNALNQSLKKEFITATDLADYLAKKGIPFRKAHKITGEIVKYLESTGKDFETATVDELKRFSDAIEDDIRNYLLIENSVNSRTSYGGTASSQVKLQIKKAEKAAKRQQQRLEFSYFYNRLSPKPTVDAIVEKEGKVLLIKRKNEPFGWALPGGFIEYGESAEAAVLRELKEETGLDTLKLRQFKVYSSPERDKRIHTISVVFVVETTGKAVAGDDAKSPQWFALDNLPELAFDHEKILKDYRLTNSRSGSK